jgi:hypothetical protein
VEIADHAAANYAETDAHSMPFQSNACDSSPDARC